MSVLKSIPRSSVYKARMNSVTVFKLCVVFCILGLITSASGLPDEDMAKASLDACFDQCANNRLKVSCEQECEYLQEQGKKFKECVHVCRKLNWKSGCLLRCKQRLSMDVNEGFGKRMVDAVN
uniref:Uncharacterized protein n=1 Tax=Mesocestoides corti TaxID=53468 RepID=A0A5K3EYM0_MESCO